MILSARTMMNLMNSKRSKMSPSGETLECT